MKITADFSTKAFVLMLLGVLSLGFGYQALVSHALMEQGGRSSVTLAKTIFNAVEDRLFAPSPEAGRAAVGEASALSAPEVAAPNETILRLVRDTSIRKVSVLDKRGLVIFSTDKSVIGADESGSPAFKRALQGEVVSTLAGHFVPIPDGNGRTKAVLEMLDVSPPGSGAAGTLDWRVFLCIALVMTAHHAGLLAVVWRSGKSIRKQRHALHSRRRALAAARDKAESANRAKSNFLASMSHEIRTPMHGVLGLVRLLRETPLNGLQRKYADSINSSGEALLRITNDILDLSKIEADKLQLDEHDFDLRHVINETLALMSPLASQKGLDLCVDVPSRINTCVRGDRMRLQQVVCNLVGNAIKFTATGSVRLSLRPDGDAINGPVPRARFRFAVSDTGIGIDAAHLDHIFEPFAQADNSTFRHFGGTGLGLAIVERLVKAMSGELSVESAPGAGSTFSFTCAFQQPTTLAVAGPFVETAPAQKRQRTRAAARRALLVEDNVVNQIVAQALLENHGYAVTVASNGAEAVNRWRRDPFEVIFIDCHMPVMDGFTATREIRRAELEQASPRVPIIAMTASVMAEDKLRCYEAGMDAVLCKPFAAEEFVSVTNRWCPDSRVESNRREPLDSMPATL